MTATFGKNALEPSTMRTANCICVGKHVMSHNPPLLTTVQCLDEAKQTEAILANLFSEADQNNARDIWIRLNMMDWYQNQPMIELWNFHGEWDLYLRLRAEAGVC